MFRIQLAYAGYPQLINPQMFQIQQPQGKRLVLMEWRHKRWRHKGLHNLIFNSASAAAPAGANAAAQMMDPSSGYAFIDPTYAALALQVSHQLNESYFMSH